MIGEMNRIVPDIPIKIRVTALGADRVFCGEAAEFGIVHPGKVESRMTHVREEGAIDAEDAIEMMLPLIDGLTREKSGMFVTREGKPLPW